MPEFVMEGRDHAAREESPFVLGFIEAMFFTSVSQYDSEEWFTDEVQEDVAEGRIDGCLPADVGYTDLHPESLASIRAYCEAWQAEHAALLAEAYASGYDEVQAGRDLWFTVNGHGVGFWDRKELSAGDLGDRLSDAARRNEINPFFGDRVAYGDAPYVYVDL